jgi:hypothetical protein
VEERNRAWPMNAPPTRRRECDRLRFDLNTLIIELLG